MNPELEELVAELENTADQLRAGELSPEDAARAVERTDPNIAFPERELERFDLNRYE